MGVESVSVARALSHADTRNLFFIPLLEYCCHLWKPWRAKYIEAIEAKFSERLHTKSLKYST